MSKINKSSLKSDRRFTEEKLAGGMGLKAAALNPEALLRRATLSSLLWEDMAYESGKENADNVALLVPQVNAKTVSDLAIECRLKQKLRHMPLFIAAEMAKHSTHKAFVEETLVAIITRPDQITDFMAIYWRNGKCPIAKCVKKGLARCFNKFNEYSLAKYNRDAPIKLRDVMFMVRPKPEDEKQAELFKRLANNTLKTPDTWEVALSSGQDKRATWERLLSEEKLGSLAFIRNLRNIHDAGVSYDLIKKGFDNLSGSVLLPLNFLAASKYCPAFDKEINDAMLKSYGKIPKLPGHTVVVIDVSGSMTYGNAGRSKFSRMDSAKAMAVLANEVGERVSIYATAGSDSRSIHKTKRLSNSRGFALGKEIDSVYGELGGGGIFTRQCLEFIKGDLKEAPDRIIIFSDSQDCDRINKVPAPFGKYNYIVDISSHKNGINYDGVWTAEISGFSEHFLAYIMAVEGVENKFENSVDS